MKIKKYKKIIIVAAVVLAAAAGALVFYSRSKAPAGKTGLDQTTTQNPPGTCSPALAQCQGNAQLCMTESKNQVCD